MQHNIVNIIIILAAANIMSRQSKALFTKKKPSKKPCKKPVIVYDVILVVSEVILEERVHNRVAVTYMTSAKIPLHKYCYLEADNDFSFLRQPIKYSTKSCPRIGKPIYSAKNVYIILCKIKKQCVNNMALDHFPNLVCLNALYYAQMLCTAILLKRTSSHVHSLIVVLFLHQYTSTLYKKNQQHITLTTKRYYKSSYELVGKLTLFANKVLLIK